jgi:hypothetical protein
MKSQKQLKNAIVKLKEIQKRCARRLRAMAPLGCVVDWDVTELESEDMNLHRT